MKIDKITKNYRKSELKYISFNSGEYKPSIKICRAASSTKYLSITEEEFNEIKKILCK